jgi:hypothetical protein
MGSMRLGFFNSPCFGETQLGSEQNFVLAWCHAGCRIFLNFDLTQMLKSATTGSGLSHYPETKLEIRLQHSNTEREKTQFPNLAKNLAAPQIHYPSRFAHTALYTALSPQINLRATANKRLDVVR